MAACAVSKGVAWETPRGRVAPSLVRARAEIVNPHVRVLLFAVEFVVLVLRAATRIDLLLVASGKVIGVVANIAVLVHAHARRAL